MIVAVGRPRETEPDSLDQIIRSVRDAMPELDNDRAVFCYWVTGSVPAGLSTTTSDLDIIAVTEGNQDTACGYLTVGDHECYVGQQRVHILVKPLDWLLQIPDLVGTFTATIRDSAQLFTDEALLKAVAQLYSGVRVVKDASGFARIRSSLRLAEIDFRRLMIARSAMYANNTQEDTIGFLAVGDLESALLRAQDLLKLGLDAWALAMGNVYPGQKWIWHRIVHVVSDPAALALVRNLMFSHDSDLGTRILQINTLTQTLLGQAMLTSWAPEQRQLLAPVVPDMAAAGIWRSAEWITNRLADDWQLTDRRRAFSVPVTAAACWTLANGIGHEHLAAAVVELCHQRFGIEVRPAVAGSVIDRLSEIGALRRGRLSQVAEGFRPL
jgi:hypothetical protein